MLFRIALLLCCLTASVFAAVIYDQPLSIEDDRGPFSQAGLQEVADQFLLTSLYRLTGLRWYGSYFEEDLAPGVTDVGFAIRLFNDQGGLPSGEAYMDWTVAASARHTGAVVENRAIYEFAAELPSIILPTGASWLSIVELGENGGQANAVTGAWRWALSAQSEEDTAAALQPGGAWAIALDRRNTAFTLLGEEIPGQHTETPEPATMTLVFTGVLGILMLRRRAAHS